MIDRFPDDSDRLAEIRNRVRSMAGYRFGVSGRSNGPGGCYRVSGSVEIVTDSKGNTTNATGPARRGPEAYFTSAGDADQYAHLVGDLLWLLKQHETLTQCMGAHV